MIVSRTSRWANPGTGHRLPAAARCALTSCIRVHLTAEPANELAISKRLVCGVGMRTPMPASGQWFNIRVHLSAISNFPELVDHTRRWSSPRRVLVVRSKADPDRYIGQRFRDQLCVTGILTCNRSNGSDIGTFPRSNVPDPRHLRS